MRLIIIFHCQMLKNSGIIRIREENNMDNLLEFALVFFFSIYHRFSQQYLKCTDNLLYIKENQELNHNLASFE